MLRNKSHTGVMDYDEACFMHLTPGVVYNFPKAVGVYDFCPLCTKRSQIPIRKEKGGNPGNSGLSSQQKMVVHYPRTVWKNSYAVEYEVTGKTFN